ncbi:MAG: hydrogenase maturation protease [Anaerolineae bacterium]
MLGDDGVGWRAVETAAARATSSPHIEFDCVALGGLSLMERLIGYKRAIIVDALAAADGRLGEIVILPLADLPDHSAGRLTAVHDTSLPTSLALGRTMEPICRNQSPSSASPPNPRLIFLSSYRPLWLRPCHQQ